MTDLGWRADGIARARAAGGLDIEVYRRPGFTGGKSVRVTGDCGAFAQGFAIDYDPDVYDDDEE